MAPDTELIPSAATAPMLDTTVVLHQAYVIAGHQRRDTEGIKGIALLLFCEWMHQRDEWKDRSESDLYDILMSWRGQVGWENVAPEVKHGETEGAQY